MIQRCPNLLDFVAALPASAGAAYVRDDRGHPTTGVGAVVGGRAFAWLLARRVPLMGVLLGMPARKAGRHLTTELAPA